MATTRAPEIIAWLTAAFDGATADDVTVYTGPPSGGDIPAQYVAVAYGGEDRPGWTGESVPDPGANAGELEGEALEIWCTATTGSGDQDMMLQYGRTQTIYDACVRTVRNSPSLGGLLPGGLAELGQFEWYPEDGGNIVTVFFSIRIGSYYIA